MSITLKEIVDCLNTVLCPQLFKDYCPNGLQVEGRAKVTKIISGVTACQALIDAAIEQQADAILVHHGYFWRGEEAALTGMKKRRLSALLKHDISLIVYHLPLDAHATLGNNVQLAKQMNWPIKGAMPSEKEHAIGNWGELNQPMTLTELGLQLEQVLGRTPLIIEGGNHLVNSIAWCTGAAQSMIDKALTLGVDAFISGEISEATVHVARENNIHYVSAGHHATERYGVQALGHFLAEKFGVGHQFIDIDSPV
ncbi:MAG: Nif3-like dinuclear metal center hexameric protein [Endozoicomonas sp. (ex Botrylloides leachii)]|nr:Nif3-like dinuclear metal center hexameric protein [Endozoicomonas sp. (ex Botrylloides leachii)]